MNPKYKRIVLKLSGEAISGDDSIFGLDLIRRISREIKGVHDLGVEIGIVIGGGNIIRGEKLSEIGFDRNRSDYMGMLATIINSIMLENSLKKEGVPAVVQSALPIETVVESIDLQNTFNYLKNGYVVIFAAGTGSPHFTTDTAASLRAREIYADLLLKATKVNGVYDKDPIKYKDAIFYPHLTYEEVLTKELSVMDMTAVSLCRDGNIPIAIFNIFQEENLYDIIMGKDVGTIIKG